MSKSNNRSFSQPIDPVRYSRRRVSIEPSNRAPRISTYAPIDPVRYSRRLPSISHRIKCDPCMNKAVCTTTDKPKESPCPDCDTGCSDKRRPSCFDDHKGDGSFDSNKKQFERDRRDDEKEKRGSHFRDNDNHRSHCESNEDRSYYGNHNSKRSYDDEKHIRYSKYCDEFKNCFDKQPNETSNFINQMVYAIKNILEQLLERLKNIENNDSCLKQDMEMLKQRVGTLEKSKNVKSNKSVCVDRSVQSFNEYRHFRKMLMKELQQIQIYDVNDNMVMTLRAIGKQTNQSIDRIFQTAFLNYVDWRFPQIRFQFPAMNFAQIRQILLNEWKQKAYGRTCNILKWLR